MAYLRKDILVFILSILCGTAALGQPCTALGQTPTTAFPVCGITTFNQSTVPICATNDLFVPGCSPNTGANYQNKNPFWYKFTCYQSGTLGFTITPNAINEDYDWQLYDITGHNPNDVFTENSLVITGNWAGTFGLTGASASGSPTISCASIPADNVPTFTIWPTLIAGHNYILMISHFSDSQSGYSLEFDGGTAVITDPAIPHFFSALANCDGKQLVVKFNKRIICRSLTLAGSEFSISPAVTTVVSAAVTQCSQGFDFDELTITLANPVPPGDYQLIINNGSDGNTLLDNCGLSIPQGEEISFHYQNPQPTPIDSIGQPGCAPAILNIYFGKNIDCSSIAADGSDFMISGPTAVAVSGATGVNCVDGLSSTIGISLTAPLYTQGNYILTLKTGLDGNTVIDECGQQTLPQSLPFNTVDTVSAFFSTITELGCRQNTLTFSHDGAHGVNNWNWKFNSNLSLNTPTAIIHFPSTSRDTVQLIVSNGICSDSTVEVLEFDNEVRAAFEMPNVICPEDPFLVTDSSSGQVDYWSWKYDVMSSSTARSPSPYYFPYTPRDAYYSIQLVVTNTTLNCKDSTRKTLRVLNNCFIAVPTAFTPNDDGLNDFLSPHNALKADKLEFKVYNRWGQLVFATHNWLEKWNGKINGLLQPSGIYVWFLSYTNSDTGQRVFQKGTTMLIR